MNNNYKESSCFIQLVCRFLTDEKNYILHINDYENVLPDKTLLGYYDDDYIYLIPSVVIGMCDTVLIQNKLDRFNMREVMYQLYIKGCIKYDYEMSGRKNFRPKKCIGKTRNRYITFVLDNAERKSEGKAVSKDTYTISETIKKYVCTDAEYAAMCEEDVVEGIFNSLLSGEKVKIGNIGVLEVVTDSNGKYIPVFETDELFKYIINYIRCGKG